MNKTAMRIAKTTAIAMIALASSAGIQTIQAQVEEQENFVWITNTNGITWKEILAGKNSQLHFTDYPSIRPTIVQIVVPEHTRISKIDVSGCANLTNLVIQPSTGKVWHYPNPSNQSYRDWIDTDLIIDASGSGLRQIIARRTTINSIKFPAASYLQAWTLVIEWTEWTDGWERFEPPKLEIRTDTTASEKEIEVVWRTGNLQIADAVNGEWKDYNGISPLRFLLTNPFAHPKDIQFFRIKLEEEQEEPEEESQ